MLKTVWCKYFLRHFVQFWGNQCIWSKVPSIVSISYTFNFFLLKIKCLKTNMNLCYFYSSNSQEVITYVNFESNLNVRLFCQFAINTPYSDNSIFKLSFQYWRISSFLEKFRFVNFLSVCIFRFLSRTIYGLNLKWPLIWTSSFYCYSSFP